MCRVNKIDFGYFMAILSFKVLNESWINTKLTTGTYTDISYVDTHKENFSKDSSQKVSLSLSVSQKFCLIGSYMSKYWGIKLFII